MTHDEVISRLEGLARYWRNAARIKSGGKLVLEGDGSKECEALSAAVKMVRQHRVIASMFLESVQPAEAPPVVAPVPMPPPTKLQLATLAVHLKDEGVSEADMRAKMMNVTGCARSSELTAETGAKCVRAFQTWLDEIRAFRRESA